MVTLDVVSLYPRIPHNVDLEAIRKALDNRENRKISTDDLTKTTEIVLKKNYFGFNGNVRNQISVRDHSSIQLRVIETLCLFRYSGIITFYA